MKEPYEKGVAIRSASSLALLRAPSSVRRSRRPQTRLETSSTRTGRP